MMKIKSIIALALVLGMNTFAADSLFNGKEFAVSVGSGYVVDTSAAFQQKYALNFAGGVSYFVNRYVGLDVMVPFYSTKDISVSEIQAGALLRVPLAYEIPVLKNLAPYVGVGFVGNWKTEESLAYVGKVGVEGRINSKCGVGVETQYRNNKFSDWKDGQMNLFGYVKLVF
jgi:hypothetical protein